MKSIKIQFFGLLILLCAALSLQGMNLSHISREAVKRKKISAGARYTAKTQIKERAPWLDSSAILGKKYKYQASQPKGWTSTKVVNNSLWKRFKSWFTPQEVTFKEVFGPQRETIAEINELLEPTEVIKAKNGSRLLFSLKNLAEAKKELGYIINGNPDAKEYVIETVTDGKGNVRNLTILDKVLFQVSNIFSRKITVAPQSILNYMALAQFLTDLGADIGADNMDMHEDFFIRLRSSYRRALQKWENDRARDIESSSIDKKIDLFASVSGQLESILIKLVPGFKDELQEDQERYEKRMQRKEAKRILVEEAKARKREAQLKKEESERKEWERIYRQSQQNIE